MMADRRPKLVFGLETVVWHYDSNQDKTLFFFIAELINQGEPTVTVGWQATYTIGSASEEMKSYYLHGPFTLTVGNETLTVTTQDLLNVKTQSVQIERGGHRGGRLLFTLPGDRREQVKSLQFRIDVTCHDYLFSPYTSTYIPSPVPVGGLQFLPTENVRPKAPTVASSGYPRLRSGT